MKALLASVAIAALTMPALAQSNAAGQNQNQMSSGSAATEGTRSGCGQKSVNQGAMNQGAKNQGATNQGATNQQRRVSADRVRQQLSGAGFQNVQIIDAAYLVRADTGDGNRVLMLINPPMGGASGSGAGQQGGSGQSYNGGGSATGNQ